MLLGAGLLLVAGVAAIMVVFLRDTGSAIESTPDTRPAQTTDAGSTKNVPLPPAARKVAGRFILTAVKREHLAEAWAISGPGIREGLTYKEWLTGAIPVVPVPEEIVGATYKTDYSHADEVQFQVALIVKPAKGSKDTAAKVFYMKVRRIGPRHAWVVDSWIPRIPVALPTQPGS
jgi:hypothetical protein